MIAVIPNLSKTSLSPACWAFPINKCDRSDTGSGSRGPSCIWSVGSRKYSAGSWGFVGRQRGVDSQCCGYSSLKHFKPPNEKN